MPVATKRHPSTWIECAMRDGRILKFVRWLFAPPSEPIAPRDAVAWWERRRLTYNLVVGAVAIVSFAIYYVSIISTGVLRPGEDVLEPVALLAMPIIGPIMVNICYTAGWVVDAPLRLFLPALRPRFTSWLFALGFAFSVLLVSFPAVYWSGYRFLQLLHLLR
jgi:hypothetical protein